MRLLGLIIAFVVVYAALLALSGLVIMLVGNVILEYFELKTLTFPVAVAISLLLSIIGAAFRRGSSDK